MDMTESFIRFSEWFYPIWYPLSHFVSSFFCFFSLTIFSFRFSRRYQPLILCVCAILCGLAIDWLDQGLSWLSFPLGTRSYLRISLVSVLFLVLFALVLYEGDRFLIALTVLLLFNLFSALRFLFIGAVGCLFPVPSEAVLWVLSGIPTCICCLLICLLIVRHQKCARSGLSVLESALWFSVAFLEMLMMCAQPASLSGAWQTSVITALNPLFSSAAIYILVFQYSREKYVTLEQQKMLRNLDDARRYLTYTKENAAQLREIRHELKNHVFYIEELLEQQNFQVLHGYLDTLKHKGLAGISIVDSGNQMIDTILNQKCAYASSLGIDVSTSVVLPSVLEIDNLTLCSVLGNLLDNAIEACEGQDTPFLRISIQPYKAYLTIRIENSIQSNVLAENPELRTTKSNAELHGIGLRMVRDLAAKYNGSLQLEMANQQTFRASVMMLFTAHP